MLKTWPDDHLKVVCKDVEIGDAIANIFDEMRIIMEEENGLGLAAPQIGVNQRAFIMRLKNKDILEVINPIILEEKEAQYGNEGCLSFPGITVQISRPMYVHAKWQDRKAEWHEGVFYEIEARCFVHENDHLLGKTILDRVNRKERKGILKQMGL